MKYPDHESSVLEFKRELPSKHQIVKTIVGMCNMFGGQLVIGVDDDHGIVGVEEQGLYQIMDDLRRSIFDSCSPVIIPAMHIKRFENKIILIIEVSEGMSKPYFIASKSLNGGTYVRLGSHTLKASPQMIHELQWQTLGKYLDEMPVYKATINDINIKQFEKFIVNRKQHIKATDIELMLKHYQITVEEHAQYYPSVAGVLLFGQEPQRYLPEAFIICTHFFGKSGREVIATRDCVGNLMQQYADAVSFIISRLNKQFTIEGTGPRIEKLEIPEQAIRETVMNAIIHRNYQIKGPTKIAIFDDRVEIFSPGIFPGPIQVNHLEIGVSYIRNTILTRVFREMGQVEKLGSGFITLFKTYQEYSLPTPIIVEGTGFVKCILPRFSSDGAVKFDDQETRLIQLFYIHHEVRIQNVIKHLGVSRATAGRVLDKLLKKKMIRRVGKGPMVRYLRSD